MRLSWLLAIYHWITPAPPLSSRRMHAGPEKNRRGLSDSLVHNPLAVNDLVAFGPRTQPYSWTSLRHSGKNSSPGKPGLWQTTHSLALSIVCRFRRATPMLCDELCARGTARAEAGHGRGDHIRIRLDAQITQGARMGRERKPFASASANSVLAGSYFMSRLSHMQMFAACTVDIV
jgi:hypothetical protein